MMEWALFRYLGRFSRPLPELLPCVITAVVVVVALTAELNLALTRPLAGRFDDQEPESHILVTELAFEQNPWRVHHFLPIFTLGDRPNKFIDEHPGAASADEQGNYFYTSTPPLTFVTPYLAAKLTAGHPTLFSLRLYNIALQAITAALLAWLIVLCARTAAADPRARMLAALTVVVIYMSAPECLRSHTIALWGQQFYCPVLLLEIIAFLFWPSALLLGALSFIACLADWTPYVAHFAMVAIALYAHWKTRERQALRVAVAIAVATALSGLCMVAWFHSVMPVHSYFEDLMRRSAARSGSWRDLQYLAPAYVNSFGLFALLGATALFWRPWAQRNSTASHPSRRILPGADPFLIAATILSFSLVENVLMNDHALNYSYDRLKGVELLAVLVAWGASRKSSRAVAAFAFAMLIGIFSTYLFWVAFQTPQGWSYIPHSQQERLGSLIRDTASADGPSFFNGEIRGSEVYYAGRNVYQVVDRAARKQQLPVRSFVAQWCREHNFREATLYEISGSYPFPLREQLPRTVHITRVHADASTDDLGVVRLGETADEYRPYMPGARYDPDPVWKFRWQRRRHSLVLFAIGLAVWLGIDRLTRQ